MDEARRPRRLVVGITGSTGVILGIRLLEALRDLGVSTHLVMSEWGKRTIRLETDYSLAAVRELASACYDNDAQAAPISSGSFPVDGMAVIPCTMNSVAAIAHGLSETLIARAAAVTMKEHRRQLVIVPRETPLSPIHLRNLVTLADNGVSIVPPVPAFYNEPQSVDDIVGHIVARTLDQFGIETDLTTRWGSGRRNSSRTAVVAG